MNCRDIHRNMSAYLDGELNAAARDAFFDHLQECEACCDLIGEAAYHETLVGTALKVPMKAPQAVRYNVLSTISREAARPARVPVWQRSAWRPAAAMAAILALAGTGWRSFTEGPRPSAPEAPVATETSPTPSHSSAARVKSAAPAHHADVARAEAPRRSYERPEVASTAIPRFHPPAATVKVDKTSPAATARPVVHPVAHETPAATPAVPPIEAAIGTVTSISAPNNVMDGRFLSRSDAKGKWTDASYDLHAGTQLQSAEDTIVTVQLKDGTVVKVNQHTEWVVLKSPTNDDPEWGIRLVRGELFVKSQAPVKVSAPALDARSNGAEFSVRSFDGEDTTVIVANGAVTCANPFGTAVVPSGQSSTAVSGDAPAQPFLVDNARGQMEWAYAPAPAYKPLDDGGTQS